MLTRRTFFSWIAGGSAALVGSAFAKRDEVRVARTFHQEVVRDRPIVEIVDHSGKVVGAWDVQAFPGWHRIASLQGPAPSGPGK